MIEVREFQTAAIEKVRDCFKAGKKRVILQGSCGVGKTVMSAEIAKRAIEKGKKVLFLVNRRDLVRQTIDKYNQYGLGDQVSFILSGEDTDHTKPIHCGSLQTYSRRLKLADLSINHWFKHVDLLIYDEVHSCNAPTFKSIVDLYKDKYVLGLSATPIGAGNTGLGNTFQEIVSCISLKELINLGYLVPAVHYAPSKPDMKGVGLIAGDYNLKQAGERVDKPKLIGDILENWVRLASDRKTIIFAVNVKHSKHIRDRFETYGIKIAHIDAHTKDDERAEIYDSFENGDLQIITNVGVACEGSDLPCTSCICVGRPTRMISRWLQMAGRGARPYPGKKDYLLLDFAGCIEEHGFVDDDVEWSLDSGKLAVKKKVVRKKEKKIMICDMCAACFTGSRCSVCGYTIPDYGKKIAFVEANLERVDGVKKKEKKYTTEEKRVWYGMFLSEAKRLGKSEKWVLAQYKTRMSVWPRGMEDVNPIPANMEVLNWLKYQRIRFAKRMQKQNNPSQLPTITQVERTSVRLGDGLGYGSEPSKNALHEVGA